ncbi:MAG: hypothetical protein J5755_05140, partial [Clostridia bacterium]|nr:hypothetical protein [Clostridia bacterium]
MKSKRKLVGAYLLYVVLALAPMAVVVGLDWRVYVATPARVVSLSIAGVAALLLVVLQATAHLPRSVKRVVVYGVIAGALWALRPIVDQLALLMTAMTGGELMAMLIAKPLVDRIKREQEEGRIGAAVAKSVE